MKVNFCKKSASFSLRFSRSAKLEALPDINLYMDQVIRDLCFVMFKRYYIVLKTEWQANVVDGIRHLML